MNCEILFRGKRQYTGEWAESVCPLGVMHAGHLCDDFDPATVGQYTGLADKNGKRVFDGDILKIAKKSDAIGGYYFPPLPYPVNVTVRWDMCAWLWETICADKYYIHFPDAWCHYECEIIGNIHDNPELLKGGGADAR